MNAINEQTLKPSSIEIVKNVFPISKAFQTGLDRVETEYYVSVDGDMILYPTCIQRLFQVIDSDETIGEVNLQLDDPILGSIPCIRIYRTKIIREIGFKEDDKGCERVMYQKINDAGYKTISLLNSGGLHHPIHLPHEIFLRFRFISEQIRYYGGGVELFNENLKCLVNYWTRTKDVSALYGIAGLFDGLQVEDISHPLSYEGREEYVPYKKIHDFVTKDESEK